jgi:hypothetical protein
MTMTNGLHKSFTMSIDEDYYNEIKQYEKKGE